MYLTAQIHIAENTAGGNYIQTLYHLCYHSARMYNVGLYSVRQHYLNNNTYLSYYDNYHCCKSNENYQLLLTDTGQQILRLVDRDIKSFFQLLNLKKQGKYSNKVCLPHYKNKSGVMTCSVQGRSCRIHENKLRIGLTKEFRTLYNLDYRYMEFTLPKNVNKTAIKEVRIIPLYKGKEYTIEIIYNNTDIQQQSTGNGILSIDVGVSNLMTCVGFSNSKPVDQFIIDGRYVKNVNYYYNKQVAKLKSAYATNKSITSENTQRMRRLCNGRKYRINEYFNKTVNYLMHYCVKNGIGTIVIGYNKEQKQEINTGKVNNQNMVYIPFGNLRSKLEYQSELYGIKYVTQEESYTSKASAIDGDAIPVFRDGGEYSFSGRRIKRGLYRSADGSILNADVNGSVNILRKYVKDQKCKEKIGNISIDSIRALVNTPCLRINLNSSPVL